jgi:hypothetical protein
MISQVSGINAYQKNSPSFGMAVKVSRPLAKELKESYTSKALESMAENLKGLGKLSDANNFDVFIKKAKRFGPKDDLKAVFKLKNSPKGIKNPSAYSLNPGELQGYVDLKGGYSGDTATRIRDYVLDSVDSQARQLKVLKEFNAAASGKRK